MQKSDLEIVQAVEAGDVEAYRDLVERHQIAVSRFVRSRVADFHEAQDVAARTFEEAYWSLGSFRADRDRSFKGWLFGIAGNLCKDWLQDKRNRNSSLKLSFFGDLDSQPDSLADERNSASRVETERDEALFRALSALPPAHRDVIFLWGVSGLSLPEVARALGINESAARKRLSRARKELRERLGFGTTPDVASQLGNEQ